MSKVIQSRRFLVALLGKLAGPLVKGGVSLAKNFLAPLATMTSACAVDGAIQRKMRRRGSIATSGVCVIKVRKGVTLVISNEDMDDKVTRKFRCIN